MKYRLKKDLPTFKAGDIFTLADNGNLYKDIGEQISIQAYTASTLKKFPNILKEWFEEIPENPKTVWDLKMMQTYYYINENGFVNARLWRDEETDFNRRNSGNCFLTEEGAKKELARRKAKVILMRDTKGFKSDWSKVEAAYFQVVYDRYKHSLVVILVNELKFPGLCFSNREDAKESIRKHEKEWKIYLGVEDEVRE